MKIFPLLFFWLGMASMTSFAQEQSRSHQDSIPGKKLPFELEEVVITAFNRSQKLLETTSSLSHIGAVLLEREQPGLNLLPIFDFVPGMFAHNGANNTNRVTIRGIGAREPYATGKIRAYLNNIPITNGSGETFLQDIDPRLVEQMEIIKGPATSAYGAGLGGTIVMQARRPANRSTRSSLGAQFGSFGYFRPYAGVDLAGDRAAASFLYTNTRSEGYRENNQMNRHAMSMVSQFGTAKTADFTLLASYVQLKVHIPSSINYNTFVNSPQSAAANWLAIKGFEESKRLITGLSAKKELPGEFQFNMAVFGIWHDELELRPFDIFTQERFTYGTRLLLEKTLKAGKSLIELKAGTELIFDTYFYQNYKNDSPVVRANIITSDKKENAFSRNFFVQADANYGSYIFSAGLNFNRNTISYSDIFNTSGLDQSGNYGYGNILSPRISAGYKLRSEQLVYLTLSHGFAPPSLSETLQTDGSINPGIKPEKSWNIEAGLRGKLFEKRLFYDLSLYNMFVSDLLVAERIAEDLWVGRNAGRSLHRGLETELYALLFQSFAVDGMKLQEFSLRANYTYSHFRFTDFVDRGNDYRGNTLPGIPDHLAHLQLYLEWANGINLQAGGRLAGKMALNDANTDFTAAYFVADIGIGISRHLSNNTFIRLYSRLNNVLNAHYASMILVNAPNFGPPGPRYYYPGLPRHFNVGLEWQF